MMSYYSKPPFVSTPLRQTETKQSQTEVKKSEQSEFNIPNIPLLKNLSPSQINEKLLRTITDEATAIDFYTNLLKQATTNEQRKFIQDIISEESLHLQMFTSLYKFLNGISPTYTITPIKFDSFKQGLSFALQGELDAMDFYKRMILSTTNQLIEQAYYFALGDETEHAIMFSTMLNML